MRYYYYYTIGWNLMLPPASGPGKKMQNLPIISHWGWGEIEAALLTVLIASPLYLLSVPFAQQQMKPIRTHYCFLIGHIEIFEVILTAMIVCSFYFSVQYHRTTYYRLTLSSVLTLGSIRWDVSLPVSMPQSSDKYLACSRLQIQIWLCVGIETDLINHSSVTPYH